MTGGVRYTDDYKSSSFLNFVDPTSSTGKVGRHFDKATWRGAVDYQVTPDKLVYFSASSGFRAGGFNPGVSSTINPAFTPETVTAYEIGTKTRWLDNTLQVNLSAFINDYKNLQVVGFDGATSLVFTQNVGEKVARGVEAEILIRPVRQFEVAISYAYLDAHWNSGSAIDQISFGSNVNLAGKQAAFSPDNRIGASASYEFALAGGGALTPRVQTQFSSQFYLLDYNTIIERQKSLLEDGRSADLHLPEQAFHARRLRHQPREQRGQERRRVRRARRVLHRLCAAAHVWRRGRREVLGPSACGSGLSASAPLTICSPPSSCRPMR